MERGRPGAARLRLQLLRALALLPEQALCDLGLARGERLRVRRRAPAQQVRQLRLHAGDRRAAGRRGGGRAGVGAGGASARGLRRRGRARVGVAGALRAAAAAAAAVPGESDKLRGNAARGRQRVRRPPTRLAW